MPFPLKVPEGFRISLYASNLGEARVITFDDQGIPYVTIMSREERFIGKIVALPDRNRDGIADEVVTVVEGVDRPHGLVFHNGSMYFSEPHRIQRIVNTDDDLQAEATEVVADGMSWEYDHWARPFVFDEQGNILVAIGSSCNSCQEGDKSRATVRKYYLDGSEKQFTTYARGLRSVVGMTWRPGTQELWAVNHGQDGMGANLPPDTVYIVREGHHYGWPYCYGDRVVDQKVLEDPHIVTPDGTPKDEFCRTKVTPPTMSLPAHVAPQNLIFYQGTQFPEAMRDGVFMAWHGAWDRSTQKGYRVVFIPFKDGKPQEPQDFVTGFLKPDNWWHGRPTWVTEGPDGSLYIVDDEAGNIYHVEYVAKQDED